MIQCNDIICGFTVKQKTEIEELDGVLYELEHTKTKLKLAWLDRADENKTFAIAFRTIPESDSGVFHILEHSVLEGSKRYPAKATFVELMKTSVNTFLNAMTFPDKTVYPFSTRNKKDFENLLRVYMDATLYPLIYDRPETFYQEGWHYEFTPDGENVYRNGVVLNEMKGVFSSVDSQMSSCMAQMLFPENCYRFNSGGVPEAISSLGYEEFIDTHRRFYHPTNAGIFIDGQVALDEILQILNDEYLEHFEIGKEAEVIPFQGTMEYKECTKYYEVSQKEMLKGKSQIALGYLAGSYDEKAKMFALHILSEYLAGSNEAPLKSAILSEKLGEDVEVRLNEDVKQPYLTIVVRNTEEDNKEAVKKTLHNTLVQIVKQGVDKKHIEALLDNLEFRCREQEFGRMPRGIIYAISVLGSRFYGGEASKCLSDKDEIQFLREQLSTDYFEKLLQDIIINSRNHVMVCMVPDIHVGVEKRKQEQQELMTLKSGWSEEEQMKWKNIDNDLKEWQKEPDTPEVLASIPVLKLSDMEKPPKDIPIECDKDNGVTLLHHGIPARGIVYMNLYFPITNLSIEELPAAAFASRLFGELDTKNDTVAELKKNIKRDFGRFMTSVEVVGEPASTKECKIFFKVTLGVLEEKEELIAGYLKNILLTTNFFDSKRIGDILIQQQAEMRQGIIAAGHQFGGLRVLGMNSASGAANEAMKGYSYYQWLKQQTESPEKIETLCSQLSNMVQRIFTRAGLTISVVGDKKILDRKEQISEIFDEGEKKPEVAYYQPYELKNEGLAIPVNVAYAVMGTNLNHINMHRNGNTQVLQKILSLNYLWNRIRVQGGAYGAGLQITREEDFYFYSYRDPNPASSLKVYQETPSIVEPMLSSMQKLDGFILGTLSQINPLLSPQSAGMISDLRYFSEFSYEDVCREWEEMLQTNPKDLINLTSMIKNALEKSGICVVGRKEQIEACGITNIYEI